MRTSRRARAALRAAVVALLLLVNAVLATALLRPELQPWDTAAGPADTSEVVAVADPARPPELAATRQPSAPAGPSGPATPSGRTPS